jgi:hypothetical protein
MHCGNRSGKLRQRSSGTMPKGGMPYGGSMFGGMPAKPAKASKPKGKGKGKGGKKAKPMK